MRLIQALYQLYALDREWDDKARAYQTVVQRLTDQSELRTAREVQGHRQEELSIRRRALKDAELELASLTEKAAETEESLYSGRVRSPKELDNLRQDADHLKERISDMEDQVLENMAEVDRLEVEAAQGQERLGTFETRWTQENQELAAQYQVLRGRLQEIQKEREGLRAQFDPSTLALYDELRVKKAGTALSPVKNGVCQTCHVTVPLHKARTVEKEGGIVTCEGCGRILYPA